MEDYIILPSKLEAFFNTKTQTVINSKGIGINLLHGYCKNKEERANCPKCGSKMHIKNYHTTTLRHLSLGRTRNKLVISQVRYYCPCCNTTKMQELPFKSEFHRITKCLENYTQDLLKSGLTIKKVSWLTGLDKNAVKDIDLKRLKDKYTIDGTTLIKPERQARVLGIDEFKLHDGHKYAVVIIDMETGYVLWLAHGKKKQTVYDFIDHVGPEWMDGVEAIACDMNSDFQEAFEDRCPHIQVVYDHFHIINNFNDKVIGEVRKDEQRRLFKEGNIQAAMNLKRTKYILTSSRETLKKKDDDARKGKVIVKKGTIFKRPEVTLKEGYEAKYDSLIEENKLLFTLDVIKEKLSLAYKLKDEVEMAREISQIMDICSASGNKHMMWFRRLLDNHFEGIIAHATYKISSGKVEDINNKIKTIRRQGYGYPDDDYFFLKIFDASRPPI